MNTAKAIPTSSEAAQQPLMHRVGEWIQDPLGSVLFATVATIGSFGIVLAGMWSISFAVA